MELSNSKVVLDTNMLLAIAQFKTDVFGLVKERLGSKVEFFAPKAVFRELEKIAEQGEKKQKDVNVVRKAIEVNKVKEIEAGERNADNALLGLAEKGFLIASNDRKLRKKIKSVGGKNIYLRKKKLIEIE